MCDLQHMSRMAKKTTMTVRISGELKEWIKELTKERRRGISGFVEDACILARLKLSKK